MSGSEAAPILLGLASAAFWGAGDFSGGLATRRTHVFGVIVASQFAGALLLVALALIFAERTPALASLLWAGLAGLAGALGLTALYSALASGRMGIAAPVSAVIAAVIPVMVGAAVEGWPGAAQLIGFGLALIGIWFVSGGGAVAARAGDLKLPVAAGVGFGLFFIFVKRATGESALWPLVAARLTSTTLMLVVAASARQPWKPASAHLLLIALAGVLDASGNAFFALAARIGRLDVTAVLSSLYPATTVWLAWILLKERLTRAQVVGVAAILAAIVLIAT